MLRELLVWFLQRLIDRTETPFRIIFEVRSLNRCLSLSLSSPCLSSLNFVEELFICHKQSIQGVQKIVPHLKGCWRGDITLIVPVFI